MIKKGSKGRIGSSFDSFLKEQGLYEVAQALAIKRVRGEALSLARLLMSAPRGIEEVERNPSPARDVDL